MTFCYVTEKQSVNVHFIFLFSLSAVQLWPALTYVTGYFLFGNLAPASTCLKPLPAGGPGAALSLREQLPQPSAGCLGDLFRISLINLCTPLSSSLFWAQFLSFWYLLFCAGHFRPTLVPCFVLSDAPQAPALAQPRLAQASWPLYCPWPDPGRNSSMPLPASYTGKESLWKSSVPLNQHHYNYDIFFQAEWIINEKSVCILQSFYIGLGKNPFRLKKKRNPLKIIFFLFLLVSKSTKIL